MINITSIQLCKQTYDELISKDGELTQEEIDFVKKLHQVVFEYKEENLYFLKYIFYLIEFVLINQLKSSLYSKWKLLNLHKKK